MPQGCFSTDEICFAYDGVECHCSLAPDKIVHFSARVKNERPSWCPLIEIPPHGRLIDADALVDELIKRSRTNPMPLLGQMVDFSPTIIESEE